jgi:hypothetical protein
VATEQQLRDENGESLLGLEPEEEERIAAEAAALLPGCVMAIDDYWRRRKLTNGATTKTRKRGRNDPCPLSWALWHRGYPDQSARAADRALAYSRELGHAHTLSHALRFAGMAAVFARDVATACAHGNDCVALASEHGFPQWALERYVRRSRDVCGRAQDRRVADEAVIRTRPWMYGRLAQVNSLSSRCASFRSWVSKPSVNEP